MNRNLDKANSIIADQIRGEWEAIKNYKAAVDDLDTLEGDFSEAIKILNDIADEEEVHVGELQKVQSTIDNNVLDNVAEGEDEAEEKVSDSNTQPLKEEVSSPLIDEIEQLITDIYEQRKEGLAEEGEFGVKNLLFKEFRNRGYLDKLKDMRNELISKELSLESLETTIDQDLNDNRQPISTEDEPISEEPYDYRKEIAQEKGLKEDTIKQNGSWVNKGKEGTHGKFKTKKAADAQRKAMYANGYTEAMEDKDGYEINEPEWTPQGRRGKIIHRTEPIHTYAPGSMSNTSGDYETIDPHDSYIKYGKPDFTKMIPAIPEKMRAKGLDPEIVGAYSKIQDSYYFYKPQNPDVFVSTNGQFYSEFDSWNNGEHTGSCNAYGRPLKYEKAIEFINNALSSNYTEDFSDFEDGDVDFHKKEISNIAHSPVIIGENGLFNIYNVKENDVERIVNQIRNLKYVDWVQSNSGRYDFSKTILFNQPQPKLYNITGQIIM